MHNLGTLIDVLLLSSVMISIGEAGTKFSTVCFFSLGRSQENKGSFCTLIQLPSSCCCYRSRVRKPGCLHAETSASLGQTSCGVSVCHRNSPRLKKWSFHADLDPISTSCATALSERSDEKWKTQKLQCELTEQNACSLRPRPVESLTTKIWSPSPRGPVHGFKLCLRT